MMMTSFCSRLDFNRILSQSLIVGALAASGLLSGIVPGLSKDSPRLVFSASAYAVDVPAEEITRYAKALLAIEQIRLNAYKEIKIIIGSSNIPEIVCNRPGSISALPGQAQAIAQNYCNQSSAIVANYFPQGKNTRFNEITSLMQQDPNLQTQIKNELVRLQQ